MPDWHVLYDAAVSETNPTVLEQLISETEDAILRRLQRVAKGSQSRLENHEIREALKTLLRLKVERLGLAPSPRWIKLAESLIMRPEFEIFHVHPNGSRLRIGEASLLDLALYLVEYEGIRSPGRYVIHDTVAGQDHVLTFELRKVNEARNVGKTGPAC